MEDEVLTSGQVIEKSGVTRRQLQVWDERGILRPSIQRPKRITRRFHRGKGYWRGKARLYSFLDLIKIQVIIELRRHGLGIGKVKRVIKFLHLKLDEKLLQSLDKNSDITLLTDGDKEFYLCTSDDEVNSVLRETKKTLSRICLEEKTSLLEFLS
jgi:DNA-binding transcriptional MerR regulator